MRRINLIIRKKHLAIAGLTVLLGAAVYVNFLLSSSNTENQLGKEVDTKNYGDTELVSAQNGEDALPSESISDTDTYMAQARLDKQQSRDKAIEALQTIYQGGDLTDDEVAVVAQDAQELGNYIETETTVENLIKAQGYADALCYISEDSANIIVKTDGLDSAGAAQIKSALLSEIEIPAENITIIEIK